MIGKLKAASLSRLQVVGPAPDLGRARQQPDLAAQRLKGVLDPAAERLEHAG